MSRLRSGDRVHALFKRAGFEMNFSSRRDFQTATLWFITIWLWVNKRKPKSLENILPVWLDAYLAEMFISIRKSDGTDNEPISLESIKNSVDRNLKDKGCARSLRDRTFHNTQQALNAKKVSLKKDGKGRNARASEPVTKEKKINCMKLDKWA